MNISKVKKKFYEMCVWLTTEGDYKVARTPEFVWSFIEHSLLTQRKEIIKTIRKEFIKLAIKGYKDRDEWKGSLLYTRTLNYLDDIINQIKEDK